MCVCVGEISLVLFSFPFEATFCVFPTVFEGYDEGKMLMTRLDFPSCALQCRKTHTKKNLNIFTRSESAEHQDLAAKAARRKRVGRFLLGTKTGM